MDGGVKRMRTYVEQQTRQDAGASGKARQSALVVDDERLIGMNHADILHDIGYEVELLSRPKDALATAEGPGSRHYDLAVLDYRFEGNETTGLDIARCLKAHRAANRIVIVTAYPGDIDLRAARRAGVDILEKGTRSVDDFFDSLNGLALPSAAGQGEVELVVKGSWEREHKPRIVLLSVIGAMFLLPTAVVLPLVLVNAAVNWPVVVLSALCFIQADLMVAAALCVLGFFRPEFVMGLWRRGVDLTGGVLARFKK